MFISNCLNISTTEIRMIKSLSSKVWIAIAVSSLHLCFEKSYGVKWMNSIALIIELYNSCVQKFNSWCPLTWWWGRVQVRPSMRPANMWLLAWNARHQPHGGCHSVIHDPPQEQMSSGSLSSPVIRPLLTPGEKCGQRIFCFSLPQYLFKVCDTWSLVRVCPLWLMR